VKEKEKRKAKRKRFMCGWVKNGKITKVAGFVPF
jgi:hypothetical protein